MGTLFNPCIWPQLPNPFMHRRRQKAALQQLLHLGVGVCVMLMTLRIPPTASAQRQCGSFNNAACPDDLCCSAYNWCGLTSLHCLGSCKPEYGKCGQAYVKEAGLPAEDVGRCGPGFPHCSGGLCCSSDNYCNNLEEYCSPALGCQPEYGTCWESQGLSTAAKAGIAVAAVAFVCILLAVAAFWWYRKTRKTARRYSFSDLYTATDGFSASNLLGNGGFGEVYRGRIYGKDVAVKKLIQKKPNVNSETGSPAELKDFQAEVETMTAHLNHKNLVAVIGFCIRNEDRFLVYEYVPGGSLDKWLFPSDLEEEGNRQVYVLDWGKRFAIAKGVAEGLIYLHHSLSGRQTIVHGDVKPDNILLDLYLTPKLADFGMAKFIMADKMDDMEGGVSAAHAGQGTVGYRAPEAFLPENEQYKADVYSFGIVLLEIVSGRRYARKNASLEGRYYLPLLAVQCFASDPEDLSLILDGALDLRPNEKHQVRRVLRVALWCLQEPRLRPNMSVVLDLLKGPGNTVDETDYQDLPPDLPGMRSRFEDQERDIFQQGQQHWRNSTRSNNMTSRSNFSDSLAITVHNGAGQHLPPADDDDQLQDSGVQIDHSSDSATLCISQGLSDGVPESRGLRDTNNVRVFIPD